MTNAMWGIVIGIAMIFGVSLYRYQYRITRTQRTTPLNKQELHEKLRDRYGV